MGDERSDNSEYDSNNSLTDVAHDILAGRPAFHWLVLNTGNVGDEDSSEEYAANNISFGFGDEAEVLQDSDSDCVVIAETSR